MADWDVLELQLPTGGTAFVIGTCHVLPHSATQVSDLVLRKKPVAVAVELCQQRLDRFIGPSRSLRDNLGELRDALLGLKIDKPSSWRQFAFALAVDLQNSLALLFQSEAGAEFRAGIVAAHAVGAAVVPVDRDFDVTESRLTSWRTVTWCIMHYLSQMRADPTLRKPPPSIDWARELFPAPLAVLAKLLTGSPVSEVEFAAAVNALVRTARTDEVKSMFATFMQSQIVGRPMPPALGDERDLLLARAIKCQVAAPGQSVVAVVGAAHLKGIAAHWASADSPESAVLAASYLKRPRSWERADIFFPRASLAVLVASGMAVWGGHRAYKAFRGKPIPQAASCSAVAPPRGWQRFRPAFAVAGLLGACGVGAALLSRFSPRAAPVPAEGAPPKPQLQALPEFQRLLRATTFRDPVTGEWCCRAPPV